MAPTLLGQLDSVDRGLIRGWARDPALPNHPVSLLVTLNGALVDRVVANRFRADLSAAGIGDGRHAFELAFENGLSPLVPHRVRVVREVDGAELGRSPWLIEPVTSLDQAALDRLATMLDDGVAQDPALLDRRLTFLCAQLDRLLHFRATPGLHESSQGWHASRFGRSGAILPRTAARMALVIDEQVPDGRRDAGSCAVLSHMAALQRLGYGVLFAPTDPAEAGRDDAAGARLAAARIVLCAAPFYASLEEVLLRHGAALHLVYVHRGSAGFRYARLIRRHCPAARLVCSLADLQHLRLARQAAIESRPELEPLARQSRRQELAAVAEADVTLVHSSTERALLEQALPSARIHVVPWAVRPRRVATGFAARSGVAFLADYAHAPNLDAARRLVREIMPLVWEHAPEMPCLLAGSRMPPGLAGDDPRLVAVGHVPDLGRLFGRVRLTVAPMAYGAGIKGKVLESLAAGIPCVCTPIAAEGLDWPPDLRRWIANDTHGLAALILLLHRDASLNGDASRAGLDWVERTLSEPAIDRLLSEALLPHGSRGKAGLCPDPPKGSRPLETRFI